MTDELDLNELVTSEGTEVTETNTAIKSGNEAEETLDSMISQVSNPGIIPGEKMEVPSADDVAMDKDEANMNMVQQLALEKLRKEKEAYQKMDDDEKLIGYLIQSEQQRFMSKYGYKMSGSQFRTVKRNIIRKWKEGKFKSWKAKYGDDVLFELNKASNSMGTSDVAKTPVSNVKDIMNPLG